MSEVIEKKPGPGSGKHGAQFDQELDKKIEELILNKLEPELQETEETAITSGMLIETARLVMDSFSLGLPLDIIAKTNELPIDGVEHILKYNKLMD